MIVAAIAAIAFAVWMIVAPPASSPAPEASAPSPIATATTTASTTPEAVVTDAHDAEQTPDPEAAGDALGVAVAAVTAYCSPSLTRDAWLAGLKGYLTPTAVVAYGTVDPAVVPCSSYVGNAVALDGDTFTMPVSVPTDAGIYEVLVTRTTPTGPWLVDRMTPPQ